jgi:hypothetical protein
VLRSLDQSGFLIAAACVSAFLALNAGPASAQTVAASCPGPPEVNEQINGDARGAQTFSPSLSGFLVGAQIRIEEPGATVGDYTVQIVDVASGTPTNTVLAQTTVSDASVPPGAGTISAPFTSPTAVVAGQVYGLLITRPDVFLIQGRSNDDCPGELFKSATQTAAFATTTFDMIFAVAVEPAIGPQPQPEPQPPPPGDSASPTAAITKGPKDKTKKRTATFEFIGTDARAVASFDCSLDGGAFGACTSPYTVKVKKGKHTFQVRAVDQAGNVGAPASDDWKRKKKKQ